MCPRFVQRPLSHITKISNLLTCLNPDGSSLGGSSHIMWDGLHVRIRPHHGILIPMILGKIKGIDPVIRIEHVNIILRKSLSEFIVILKSWHRWM